MAAQSLCPPRRLRLWNFLGVVSVLLIIELAFYFHSEAGNLVISDRGSIEWKITNHERIRDSIIEGNDEVTSSDVKNSTKADPADAHHIEVADRSLNPLFSFQNMPLEETDDRDEARHLRFPSVEERLKIYMSNWYAPPCGENNDGFIQYNFTKTTLIRFNDTAKSTLR